MSQSQFCGRTRREFLWEAGGGFAGLALASQLDRDGFFSRAAAQDGPAPAAPPRSFVNPMAPKRPMFPAKAKSVIFIFCYGGPSQVDTFDHKPELYRLDGRTIPVRTFGRGGHKAEGRVVGPKWAFKPYGRCGKLVSDLFPNVGSCVDDIAFVHSLYAESPIHGSALLMMNSGRILSGHPSLGGWVTYGLGSENENLPGYVVMLDRTGGPISGPKNWASGYMPAAYQGVVIRADRTPIHDLSPPPGFTREQQRTLLDRLKEKNEEHLSARRDNTELAARKPHREAVRVMVTAGALGELGRRLTAKFAAPDDERLVEQPPALEVLEQTGDRQVGVPRMLRMVGDDVAVGVPVVVVVGAAGVDLNEPHPALDEPTRQQALAAEVSGSGPVDSVKR